MQRVPSKLLGKHMPCEPLGRDKGVDAIGAIVEGIEGPRLQGSSVQRPQLPHQMPCEHAKAD